MVDGWMVDGGWWMVDAPLLLLLCTVLSEYGAPVLSLVLSRVSEMQDRFHRSQKS